MVTLKEKTLFITGASRGIGKAIALAAARDGANVVIASKTTEPHVKLEGTIYTAAAQVEAAGGKALPLCVDVRREDEIAAAVAQAVERFGGLDILVNNASALFLAGTVETPMKRFDLVNQVNARGAFACSKACIPHLARAKNPHILNLSPPLTLAPHWFANHLAYSISKFGMSLCTLGMAEELKDQGIAVNSLWPRTAVATAAVVNLLGGEEMAKRSRKPEIVGDAARAILLRDSRSCTGNFFLDEDVLRAEGVRDFERYAVTPGEPLFPDLFVDPEGL